MNFLAISHRQLRTVFVALPSGATLLRPVLFALLHEILRRPKHRKNAERPYRSSCSPGHASDAPQGSVRQAPVDPSMNGRTRGADAPQCDHRQPTCGWCARHRAPCEYPAQQRRYVVPLHVFAPLPCPPELVALTSQRPASGARAPNRGAPAGEREHAVVPSRAARGRCGGRAGRRPGAGAWRRGGARGRAHIAGGHVSEVSDRDA